jgi:predicted transcriptional regulator
VKTIKVKDLMTPKSEYPAVSQTDTLKDAVRELKKAERRFAEKGAQPPRAVLVLDKEKGVIGKLTHWDILRALEPKYKTMGEGAVLSHGGWSAAFLKSMVDNYGLLETPLNDACCEAAELKVEEVMTPVYEQEIIRQEKEIVEDEDYLREAIHLLLMGNLMTLFVRHKGQIVGVLRLSDVFDAVSNIFEECILPE